MNYNLLWIDDEHEQMIPFKGRAKRAGFKINAFKSLEGISELERNYMNYDCVLFDARFTESENDISGTEHTQYVHRAKERLLALPKKFEIFVLTGQAITFNSADFKEAFPNCYEKGSDESIEKLFTDMKMAADRQPDTQLRHKFANVFSILDEKCLGPEKHSENLLTILRSISDDNIAGLNQDFNAMRKILESLFDRLSELEILPNDFVGKKGWINGSSKFISDEHHLYDLIDQTFFHPMIQETLKNVLFIVQDAAHNEGQLALKCDDFCLQQKTGYLYKSTVYAFLDILVYFSKLMANNQDPEKNSKRWFKLDEIEMDNRFHPVSEGTITDINKGGWGIYSSYTGKRKARIYKDDMKAENINIGDTVKIVIREETNNRCLAVKKI